MLFFCLVGKLVLVTQWKLEVVWDMLTDVFIPYWVLVKPAITVTFTAYSNHLSVTSGSKAHVAENRKHASNDAKCLVLGWVTVYAFGSWVLWLLVA